MTAVTGLDVTPVTQNGHLCARALFRRCLTAVALTCSDGFGVAVFRYPAAADPLEPLEDHAAGISNMVNFSTPVSAESSQKHSRLAARSA